MRAWRGGRSGWCVLLAVLAAGHRAGALPRHWRETDTETLWTIRYTNCDCGYAVILRPGVVAHGTHAPSPNHGFLVSLHNVGTEATVWGNGSRWISVDASYDDGELPPGIIRTSTRRRVRESDPRMVWWAGLLAVETRNVTNGVIDQGIAAVRSGIVYSVTLRTDDAHFAKDEREYRRVVAGFRLLKLPPGECSNG